MPERVPALVDIEVENEVLKTFMLFIQTGETVLKYADAKFYNGANTSAIKYAALKILNKNDGTMTHTQLANWLFKEPHSITKLVERLKRDGLVVTKRQTRDRRAINIIITDKGREHIEEATPTARELAGQVMSSISEEEAAQLGEMLGTLRQNAHQGLVELSKK